LTEEATGHPAVRVGPGRGIFMGWLTAIIALVDACQVPLWSRSAAGSLPIDLCRCFGWMSIAD
jgi:hypothetical protein